jgi:glycosyltransferase involved in cell wall biosynthesis
MTPLVSVIVPVYNGARYLGEALDSALAQDYGAVEVIVIDNGSTDDSRAVAAARNVKLLHQERPGAGAARNTGIDASRGEILAFLDQDDVWLPSKLSRQVEFLLANPDRVSLVQQTYFFEAGVEAPVWFGKRELLAADHTGWAPSCIAVRRATWDRVGRYDESLRHASDVDWFARARHLGIQYGTIGETLVRRRIHAENDSGNPAAMKEFYVLLRAQAARKRAAAASS